MTIKETVLADGNVKVNVEFIATGKDKAALSSTGKMKLGLSGGWKDTDSGAKINICYGYRA